MNIEVQINEIKRKLDKKEFQKFYDTDKDRYISYAEFVSTLEEQKKQTLFDIKESTGDGNYTNVDKWNITQVFDYLQRKEKQIKKLKAKYKTK